MSPMTDDHLERQLRARAGGPAVALTALARSATDLPQRRQVATASWRRLGVASVGIAAALVVAFVGAPLLRPPATTPSSSLPGTTISPSPMSAPATTPTSASTAAPWTSLAWTKSDAGPFRFDHTQVTDAIPLGDGFVAVGSTWADDLHASHIWSTDDGRTWHLLDDPLFDGLVEPRIFRAGDRLVVLAERRSSGGTALEIRVSDDGGRTWRDGPGVPARLQPEVRWAVGGPLGLLVPGAGKLVLMGPDLSEWTSATGATQATGAVRGARLAAGRDRWFLSGATGSISAGAPPTVGAIWTSRDGRGWEKASVESPGGSIDEIHPIDAGYVAIGRPVGLPCEGCAGALVLARAAWFSPDGTAWTRLPGAGDERGDPLFASYANSDGHRLIAGVQPVGVVGRDPHAGILQTTDARTWSELQVTQAGPDDLFIAAIGPRGLIGLEQNTGDPKPWWGEATFGR